MEEKKVQIGARVSPDLRRELKMLSIQEGVTIEEIIIEGVKAWCHKFRK